MIEKENNKPSPSLDHLSHKHVSQRAMKLFETLIDVDPHASRVIRYLRLSDYAVWLGATGALPAALYPLVRDQLASDSQLHAKMADPAELKMRPPLYLGSVLSFIEGFLMAYQCSSGLWKFFQIWFLFLMLPIARFWDWSESAWIQSRLWWAQPTCYGRQTLWRKLSVWVRAKHHIPQFAVFSVQILYCH